MTAAERSAPAPVPRFASGVLPGAADAAAWAAASCATQRLMAQTLEVLRNGDSIDRLVERYGNVELASRAGHMFETMHALSFDLDAIAKDATVRARVTEWMAGGTQNGPVNLHLVDQNRGTADIQAKFGQDAPRLTSEIGRDAYEGMGRLVPEDKLADVERILDKRLTLNPDGLRYESYADARAHVTDRLHADGVNSDPVSTAQVLEAAGNPNRWQTDQERLAFAKELGAATATATAVGSAVGFVVSLASHTARIRAGETSAMSAAVTATGAAASSAARSGAIAGLGQSVMIASRLGHLPDALGGGTLPFALSRAALDVGAAGFAFARGEIDPPEMAARTATAVGTSALVWACGAVGQTVIPIPVVGALVGGTVGQVSATVITQGLRIALVAAAADRADEARLARLEAEVAVAVALSASLRRSVADLAAEHHAYVAAEVLPRLAAAEEALRSPAPDGALTQLADLIRAFGGQPLFVSMDEFRRWMLDPTSVLALDPNPRPTAVRP